MLPLSSHIFSGESQTKSPLQPLYWVGVVHSLKLTLRPQKDPKKKFIIPSSYQMFRGKNLKISREGG